MVSRSHSKSMPASWQLVHSFSLHPYLSLCSQSNTFAACPWSLCYLCEWPSSTLWIMCFTCLSQMLFSLESHSCFGAPVWFPCSAAAFTEYYSRSFPGLGALLSLPMLCCNLRGPPFCEISPRVVGQGGHTHTFKKYCQWVVVEIFNFFQYIPSKISSVTRC